MAAPMSITSIEGIVVRMLISWLSLYLFLSAAIECGVLLQPTSGVDVRRRVLLRCGSTVDAGLHAPKV